ncbi:XdhC family protein [Nitratireductor indicus]|uniref:Sulfurylase large subunit, molybdopterin cytosine dinucleotide biosynthesis n=1 Tax=Nitratireductor indicus C115 TaxID=1231190 RepID=K2P612_9HYPH|nr:XdhC family protein [Nitratireductor indicus]EKF42766.1 sulfurylase large subunit, molybdopterin cytosine dinucleotide biosynthesis [Nitratireductor indicus C115]MDS1134866.1 XdhC family protein [Nitratireductor indicus]SFQ39907.1 xanthine dehydrogenase accessory factor [Nitratireductor indicus]
MDPHSLKKLNALRRERKAAILLTDLGDGRDRVVQEADTVAGPLGEAVGKAFRSGRSGAVEIEGRAFFLNVHLPAPRLVVVGAVHISQALAPMARIAGFDLTVIDPRTAFASPERFPGVTLHAEWPDEVLARDPLDAYTAVAALTHDPKIDDPALLAALGAGCFYIGALGSRKTHARRVERLLAAGVSEDRLARIEAPIGMNIGASSPAEIAVAVLGSVIAALRSRGLGAREQAA